MTIVRTASALALVLASCSGVVVSNAAAGQDALARARELYTSAAYDEALELFNLIENGSPGEKLEVDQYRAFCLLALGRNEDARKVIQQIVEANPLFQLSEAHASPRLQEAFRNVRRRILPSIVRQSYADGKVAFERNDFELALRWFDHVIMLLNDPDVIGSEESNDLRTLSTGFRELIRLSIAPVTMPAVAARPVPANPKRPPPFE